MRTPAQVSHDRTHAPTRPRRRGRRRIGQALEHALPPLCFDVDREVPLADAIDLARIAASPFGRDVDALRSHSFDYLVRDHDGRALFAIEFDGPHHAAGRRKIADLRKNRACWIADLTLLRLGEKHTRPRYRCAAVDFIIERHRNWLIDRQRRGSDNATASEDGPPPATHDLFADERLWFDLENPFPPSRELAAHLWDRYRVQSNFLEFNAWCEAEDVPEAAKLRLEYAGSGDRIVSEFHREVLVRRELRRYSASRDRPAQLLASFKSAETYAWGLPTFPGPGSISPVRNPQFLGLPESVYLWHELPGVTLGEVAHHLADFQALTQAAAWARSHLGGRAEMSDG